jgi:hypothetical protein
MNKQTAVEWLIEQLPNKLKPHLKKEFEQAKEMEKEQIGYTKADIIKAGEMGEINYLDTLHITTYLDEAKKFNETYGGNK